jgi:glutamate synthase (NADPH) large chain
MPIQRDFPLNGEVSDEVIQAEEKGLYVSPYEHDACGVGFVAQMKGVASHAIVQNGLKILENLDHRGAVGADPLMADGAGVLIQIPDVLYRAEMLKQKVILPPVGEYGVGMVFLPKEEASRLACEQELERAVRAEGQVVLGWRDVPVDQNMPMSAAVKHKEPIIRQIFIGRGPDIIVPDALERKLYVIRKTASSAIQALHLTHGREYYVPSMSCRTVVYKGLLLADQVGAYFIDLQDERLVSAFALVHQRFSTNTFPEWSLAHPFRMVAHNGEINTVKGNFNWMRAREGVMRSPVLGSDLQKLYPVSFAGQSDTATFDNALELLTMAGYSLAHAVMMMIPEAWEKHASMNAERRAFYEYHAAMLEPWDGPAAMLFTDGRQIGATLDRNGLRPARYSITDQDWVIMASESGVLPIPEEQIVKKGRLQPGKMFLIDFDQGRIIEDEEIKRQLASAKPYGAWIKNVRIPLAQLPTRGGESKQGKQEKVAVSPLSLVERQIAFGYTQEDIKFILEPMAERGEEAISSMGNDTPLAVLSHQNKSLFHYFKQLFAQVTNPPIDPIRESIVMSLVSYIGPKPDLLDINTINPPMRLEVDQPILWAEDMQRLQHIEYPTRGKFKSYTLTCVYPVSWKNEGIEAKLASLCAEAVDAIRSGHTILIISDRGMDREHVAIPVLLALSAIHHHLIRKGLRTTVGLVVETGAAREVHHIALLAGYGAEAIHPYLAMETLEHLYQAKGKAAVKEAIAHYVKAMGKGLSKIMSKMGISTYRSYCGAQIFEAIGLQKELVQRYFLGTVSQVGGMGIFDIAEEAIRMHQQAFSRTLPPQYLGNGGEYAWRAEGEAHLWSPDSIAKLQHSVRANRYETYKEYAKLINDQSRQQATLRGLLEFKSDPTHSIALDEVEPASEIVKRFATGAMSLGSISTEAHVTLAVAMNRIGGKSNTGEGGEDPARYRHAQQAKTIDEGTALSSVLGEGRIVADYTLQAGDSLRSRIKQVASGRFGVTIEYLLSADQIQIKMAQGAKPGEGGQIPGGKVTDYIAFLRYSVPGVGLISPPPHHDIYSIEDLAQLIHDLKNANDRASISVKLVSEIGVGTVAAGVAKAKADHIVIAGHDGGTGASPLSSIKHAGTPWELGLAETQQTLILNRLRSRIRVQVDGQIKTGRDVVIGALLGADEFGFATAPLVAEGCIMMRKCHLNTCPVGVATQDPVLRAKFQGRPEHVVNYFFFVAEEVRELMAQLGVRSFNELIGRTDLIEMKTGLEHWKVNGLDLSRLLHRVAMMGTAHYHTEQQDHQLDKIFDQVLIEACRPALERGESVQYRGTVRNGYRTIGTMLSGALIRRYPEGLADDTVTLHLQGTAGQSLGAFLAQGITLELTGDANDYTGKGLSGGCIVVRPHPDFKGLSHQNSIVGNTALYGATQGKVFLAGVAGERFAVRLSGATAVVEGTGDHGCEYMTGGTVVVLGETGRNFAAGMSGGVAYVFDEWGLFSPCCNKDMVDIEVLRSAEEQSRTRDTTPFHIFNGIAQPDEVIVKQLIEEHVKRTGSRRAKTLLKDWIRVREHFVKILPKEYRRVLMQAYDELTGEKKSLMVA